MIEDRTAALRSDLQPDSYTTVALQSLDLTDFCWFDCSALKGFGMIAADFLYHRRSPFTE